MMIKGRSKSVDANKNNNGRMQHLAMFVQTSACCGLKKIIMTTTTIFCVSAVQQHLCQRSKPDFKFLILYHEPPTGRTLLEFYHEILLTSQGQMHRTLRSLFHSNSLFWSLVLPFFHFLSICHVHHLFLAEAQPNKVFCLTLKLLPVAIDSFHAVFNQF